MKKLFAILILLMSFGISVLTEARRHDGLAPLFLVNNIEQNKHSFVSEGYYRAMLYRMAKKNPYFYKMSSTKDNKDYFVTVLKSHIKKLEDKLDQHRTGLASWSMAKGSLSSVFAGFSAYIFYIFYSLPNPNHSKFNHNAWDKYMWDREKADVLFSSFISFLGCSGYAGWYFNKVRRYDKRVVERILRDKELITMLED